MEVLRLKEFRKKAKMSQIDIAEALNITQPNYSRLESGKSLPNAKQILQLCDIIECSPNDLFGFRGGHIVVGEKLRSDE